MTVVTIEEASSRLSELAELAGEGEAVRITQVDKPVLELRVAEGIAKPQADRVAGQLAGQIVVGPEFFEPMDEEELALWYGDSPRGRLLEEIGKEWELRNGEKT